MSYLSYPDHASVWVYQSNRELTTPEQDEVLKACKAFVDQWHSHGDKVEGDVRIFHGRFLTFFVDEDVAATGGCSIDQSTSFLKKLQQTIGVDFFDRLNIAYRSGQEISAFRFQQLDELLQSGQITAETVIFNNSVTKLGDWKTLWEIPLADSWLWQRASTHLVKQ